MKRKIIISLLLITTLLSLTGCNNKKPSSEPKSSVSSTSDNNNSNSFIKKSNYYKDKTLQEFINAGNIVTRATNYDLDDVYFTAESEDGTELYSFVLANYATDEDVDIYTNTEENINDYSEFLNYKLGEIDVLNLSKLNVSKYKNKEFSNLIDNNFEIAYVLYNNKDTDVITKQGVEVVLKEFNLHYLVTFKDKEVINIIKSYNNKTFNELEDMLRDYKIKSIEEVNDNEEY